MSCTAHENNKFKDLCENYLKIKVFVLPAHSSNQTQPLDLVTFHSHKANIKKYIVLFESADDSALVKQIIVIVNGWYSCCTPEKITSAFRAMGAYFTHKNGTSIVHFNKNYAHKLTNHELTKEERLKIIESTQKDYNTRMTVQMFNSLSPEKMAKSEVMFKKHYELLMRKIFGDQTSDEFQLSQEKMNEALERIVNLQQENENLKKKLQNPQRNYWDDLIAKKTAEMEKHVKSVFAQHERLGIPVKVGTDIKLSELVHSMFVSVDDIPSETYEASYEIVASNPVEEPYTIGQIGNVRHYADLSCEQRFSCELQSLGLL